jgi:hypothetical protein
LASATAATTCHRTHVSGLGFFTIQWSPGSCLKPYIPLSTGGSRRKLKGPPLGAS